MAVVYTHLYSQGPTKVEQKLITKRNRFLIFDSIAYFSMGFGAYDTGLL